MGASVAWAASSWAASSWAASSWGGAVAVVGGGGPARLSLRIGIGF